MKNQITLAFVLCLLLGLMTLGSPSLFAQARVNQPEKNLQIPDTVVEVDGARPSKVPIHITLPVPARKISKGSFPIEQLQRTEAGGLVTIMSEGFEGVFPPTGWGYSDGDYTWGKRNYYAHSGSSSAWAIGGGPTGSTLTKDASYPNDVSTLLVYGPFDLSDVNYAAFSFYLWLDSETNYDFFQFMASTNGSDFYGYAMSGSTSGGWVANTMPLTAVPIDEQFVDMTGSTSVYIAFGFVSDQTTNMPNGAFVDDVTLQKGIIDEPVVETSFATPGSSSRGMAYDGTNLWCSDATNKRIYNMTITGTTITSFATPGSYPSGLAWDGTNLWSVDYILNKIYKHSSTGSVLNSFASAATYPAGLTWDGTHFWNSDLTLDTIWKLTTTGTVASTISAPGTYHYGLAWDGQNLWMVDADLLLILKLDPAGNVLDYIKAPGTFPAGLAWDGASLWLTDRNTDLIYKLQVPSGSANDVGVSDMDVPATLTLGNSATVEVTINNYGDAAHSNFPVSYDVNGGSPVTESFTGTIPAGETASYTFSTQWHPAVEGTYQVSAWTSLSGDENPANDRIAMPKEVVVTAGVNTPPVLAEIGNQTVEAGQVRSINLSATDENGDALTFTIPLNPGFLAITDLTQNGNTAVAKLVVSPAVNQTGDFNATIQVSDPSGANDTETISIHVNTAQPGGAIKLYLDGSPTNAKLTPNVPSGNIYERTASNMSVTETFKDYFLAEDIVGSSYTVTLLCATSSGSPRSFSVVIRIGGQQVASGSVSVVGATYTYYTTTIEGIDPDISGLQEVELLVTINGSNGANSGLKWGLGKDCTLELPPFYRPGKIDVSPASVNETVPFETSRNVELTISNFGLGNLSWSAAVAGGTASGQEWLKVLNPSSGQLAPGASTVLTASLTGIQENATFDGEIRISSDDPTNALIIIPVSMTVIRKNRPPRISAITDKSMAENSELSVSIASTDPDDDALTLSVQNLPLFGSFSDSGDGTGSITFTPGYVDETATYGGIMVIVTDSGTPQCADTASFALTVEKTIDDPHADLISVSFADANSGTAVGSGGTILRTIDGGRTWSSQAIGTTKDLYSVSFTDANTGTTVGDEGVILRTINGGRTWISRSISGMEILYTDVCFTEANKGTIVSLFLGIILRTTNGGETWTSQSSGTTKQLYDVDFTDVNTGIVVGASGTLLKTINAGIIWSNQTSGTNHDLLGVSFTDVNNATAVGLSGTILCTTNGGSTWVSQASGTTNDLLGVFFIDANVGTVVGKSGIILRTTNGGATWTIQSSGTTNNLSDVSFTDANTGIVVGSDRTILRTTDGGATWIPTTPVSVNRDPETSILPNDFCLEQNYPNPFNPVTGIRFGLSQPAHVLIEVFDVMGKKVATLIDDQMSAGYHLAEFDGSQYSSGVYLYVMHADQFVGAHKMTLVR
jgi:photosystem II stability/assembly factor-like uncharacterized protein